MQPADAYPVRLVVDAAPSASRFWAIPIIGCSVKGIILIPHFIVVGVIGFVVALLQLVLWIPVLFGGGYPAFGRQLAVGYLQWQARLSAFFLGITDRYPPFEM